MATVHLPIRQLVEFLLRTGSIDSRFTGFDRALEGAHIHRKLQKAAGTPTLTGCSSILCQAVFYRILSPVTSLYKDFVVLAELLHYTKGRYVETVRFCRRFYQWI